MKNNIKDFLLNENKNNSRDKNGLLELEYMYQEIFEFIEESIEKSTSSLLGYKIIDESTVQKKRLRAKELADELKTICLENSKTSFLIWSQKNIIIDQEKKISEQSQRIDKSELEKTELNKVISIAKDEINSYKEEVERASINTLNDLEKNLENARKDLISIGRTAEKFKEIETENLSNSNLGNIQNNIIGNLENILVTFKNLKLWPEYEEIPNFDKNENVKAKSLKSRSKKKTTKKEDDVSFEDSLLSEKTVFEDVTEAFYNDSLDDNSHIVQDNPKAKNSLAINGNIEEEKDVENVSEQISYNIFELESEESKGEV
jgi:hypothetical protein